MTPKNQLCPMPEPFVVTEVMYKWAYQLSPRPLSNRDIQDQTELFIDHHLSKASRFADWTRAWQTWMRRASLSKAGRSW